MSNPISPVGLILSRQPHPLGAPLVEPPCPRAPVVHRTPPHVALIPAHERAGPRAVHHGRVVPGHEVAGVAPLDAEHVLVLRGVREQPLDQLARLRLGDALERLRGRRRERCAARHAVLEVVQVVCDVHVRPARGLVDLQDAVAAEGERFGVDVAEVGAVGGRGFFARVHQTVCADVVVLLEGRQQRRWEVGERCAGVGEVGVAAMAGRWEFVCAEERVACAPRVEGGVDVEDAVALCA